jgi:hypothetical protein
LVGLGVLALGLAGCGAESTATAVPSGEPTATTVPAPVAETPTEPAAPSTPLPTVQAELYDHAPDYSWIAGPLRQEGDCWIVSYVSPLVGTAPDQYNNQLALAAGAGWNPADFSPGAWVIVQGQPQPGTDPASGCAAHGYAVTRVQLNPKTPKASDSLR